MQNLYTYPLWCAYLFMFVMQKNRAPSGRVGFNFGEYHLAGKKF
jgi:hypothetical protein